MTDKRLAKVMQNISKFKGKPNISLETLNLDFQQFKFVLSGNLPLLIKIFRNDLIIPEFTSFCESVTSLYQKLKDNFNGEVSVHDPFNLLFYYWKFIHFQKKWTCIDGKDLVNKQQFDTHYSIRDIRLRFH